MISLATLMSKPARVVQQQQQQQQQWQQQQNVSVGILQNHLTEAKPCGKRIWPDTTLPRLLRFYSVFAATKITKPSTASFMPLSAPVLRSMPRSSGPWPTLMPRRNLQQQQQQQEMMLLVRY
jgi:hypothetical protein